MDRFKAFKLTETPDKKIRAEFVDYTLDQLMETYVRPFFATAPARPHKSIFTP